MHKTSEIEKQSYQWIFMSYIRCWVLWRDTILNSRVDFQWSVSEKVVTGRVRSGTAKAGSLLNMCRRCACDGRQVRTPACVLQCHSLHDSYAVLCHKERHLVCLWLPSVGDLCNVLVPKLFSWKKISKESGRSRIPQRKPILSNHKNNISVIRALHSRRGVASTLEALELMSDHP